MVDRLDCILRASSLKSGVVCRFFEEQILGGHQFVEPESPAAVLLDAYVSKSEYIY